VYAEFDEPRLKTRKGKGTGLVTELGHQGLIVRSEKCQNKAMSEDPALATVADFACRDCIEIAENAEELNSVVRMVIKLDTLLMAEAKCYGKPGARLELTTLLEGRSYTDHQIKWLDTRITKEILKTIGERTTKEDRKDLIRTFGCMPHKNAALSLVYETRALKIVVRPTIDGEQDAIMFCIIGMEYGIIVPVWEQVLPCHAAFGP
jgi:hypothetical protein